MSISGILIATAIVGGIGLFIGLFLGGSAILFKVEVNEKEEAILAQLPGNNCGGCGYPGCAGLAAAIAAGEAPVNACPVGGAAVGKRWEPSWGWKRKKESIWSLLSSAAVPVIK